MRLADFILSNRERILREWESFARTCAPASGTMDIAALRDHAGEMLSVIAEDLQTPQSKLAQASKSQGNAPQYPDATTAAEEHGAGRAGSGFTIAQMIAEYRALRASVVRLWTEAKGELVSADVEDLTRFHEAIDQSLAESVVRYNHDLEQSKELFLAILGHDLRTPLAAIGTSAAFMLESGELGEPHRTLVARIGESTRRTIHMVGDLLDFTRSRLGEGIPITPEETDLARIVRDIVDEISAAYPACTINLDANDEQRGTWDRGRISQALSNLITNAVQHGEGGTISVRVSGVANDVAIAVHNRGTISAAQLDGIFNPMKATEHPARRTSDPNGSLGLGLYIAERIVTAHDGRIEVDSSDAAGTTFTVRLPRHHVS